MSEPIISVSGLRGIIGETFTPVIAMRYAAAFAADLPAGPLVITRDGRATGPMLADAIQAALVAVGTPGRCWPMWPPRPPWACWSARCGAAGGIQISASHNPPAYNGLKLLRRRRPRDPGRSGRSASKRVTWTATALGRSRPPGCGSGAAPITHHSPSGRSCWRPSTAPRIRSRRFACCSTANHGAGSLVGAASAAELGLRGRRAGRPNRTGQFAHPPEPTAENLAGVALGRGRGPGRRRLLPGPRRRSAGRDRRARPLHRRGVHAGPVPGPRAAAARQGPIVTNCSTSRMSEDLAATSRRRRSIARAVGEANVVDAMLDSRRSSAAKATAGRSIRAWAWSATASSAWPWCSTPWPQRRQPLSQLADELPRYEIDKTKIALDRETRSPPRSTPWKSTSPTPRPTASTDCGSTGPTAGCWSAPATPSRSSAPSPRPKT